jgi:hypothetical protein
MLTMDIYEFMAKMLYFLPDPNRGSATVIRYYGIYAHGVEERLQLIQQASWSKAIEHCFHANPINCPDCGHEMKLMVVYEYFAYNEIKKLRTTHELVKGYFRPRSRSP